MSINDVRNNALTNLGFSGNNNDKENAWWTSWATMGLTFDEIASALVGAANSVDIASFSTPQDAIDYCIANDKILTGQGTYTLTEPLNIASASVFMPYGTFRFDDTFTATVDQFGILVGGNASNDPAAIRKVVFNVDGNKAGQSQAQIAVMLNGMNSPLGDIQIKGFNCYTLVQARGSTEKINGDVYGYNCDLIVHDKDNGADTPDENVWNISGSGCNKLYRCEGASSSVVHFNCEATQATSDNCIELLGSKANTLSGIVRGVLNNGILIDDSTEAVNVSLNELKILNFFGSVGLNVERAGVVTGSINFKNVEADNVALINGLEKFAKLDISAQSVELSAAANYCVKLGSATRICKRADLDINLIDVTVGKGVQHFDTDNCTVRSTSMSCDYDVQANSKDDFISLPATFVETNQAFTTSSPPQAPTVEFRGNLSITDLDNFTSGFEGMRALNCRSYEYAAMAYIENGWTTVDFIMPISSTNVQDIANRINTKGKHRQKPVYVTDTRQVLYADGANANSKWRDSNGTTVYTPA